MVGSAIFALCFRQRHSSCRERVARGAASSPAHINSDQVFWRRAGYRLGTRARPRGAERADGREHRQSGWRLVSSGQKAFPGLARRRRGSGTRRGLQRAGRRGDIRVGGIDPGVRASHRDSGDRRVRDRDFGVAGDSGTAPDFHVGKLAYVGAEVRPLFFLFGVIAGGAAVLYCEALLGVISLAESLDRRFVGLYTALAGAVVGAVAWLAPDLVGGGDAITQNTLLGTQPLFALCSSSFSALASARSPTPPRRRGEYSRQCSFWARSSG